MDSFFVVGVGASAGGLEALEKMFSNIPPDVDECPMAFVIVQHLSPDFKSLMDELLARHTKLTIHRVEDGMAVEPGCIYLLPPKKDMIISDGRLLLSERDTSQQLSLPIDHFFRSLAQDQHNRSVGIILSGTGSDGSRGIRRIHENGGLVISQSEESARFDGMPRAAIDSGCVDAVVEAEEIGNILVQYAREPFRDQLATALKESDRSESAIGALFQTLQKEYGLDFRYYKSTTISRRIQRRISITHTSSLAEYAQLVDEDKEELRLLYADLLIGVTRFFRDQPAFEALDEQITKKLAGPWRGEQVRVWVCACATGEEAYSIAILLHERMVESNRHPDIKIFATDIDRTSLEFASQGIYSEASIGQMSGKRRERYFKKIESGYQVAAEIRQLVVFAPHNILRDAPFTNLHLVTCRNLLIYFNSDAQKKALSLFHFGLNSQGLLFLGSSETVGDLSEELGVVDKEARLFTKLRDIRLPTGMREVFNPTGTGTSPGSRGLAPPPPTGQSSELLSAYDKLLAEFMPPSVLINDQGMVVETFGDAAKYLRVRPGRMSTAILDMVDGDVRIAISGGIQRARAKGESVSFNAVRAIVDGEPTRVKLSVQPQVQKSGREFLLVLFEETDLAVPEPQASETIGADAEAAGIEHVRQLEIELQVTKENLQATVEELETSNEELQATNEELVASNEELQSTNEELHSVNEELYTVNAEHQRKIQELTEITADMDNLLASTEVHTVFLDEELRIRRFTPKAMEVFNFVPADLGRHFSSFTHRLERVLIESNLVRVLETGEAVEEEAVDHRGQNYLLRILPYRSQGEIRGVVVTLVDIMKVTEQKKELELLRIRQKAIFDSVQEGILGISPEGIVKSTNTAASELLGVRSSRLIDRSLADFFADTDTEAGTQKIASLAAALSAGESVTIEDVEMIREGRRTFAAEVACSKINASMSDDLEVNRVVVIRDISERIEVQRALEERERELRLVTDSVPALISYVDRNLRYQFVNKQYSELWGRPRDEFKNLPVRELLGEEASQKAESYWTKALSGDVVQYEMFVGLHDPAFWANITYTPNVVDGEVDGFFATIINTSEIKQAEDRFRRALRSSGDALFDWKLEDETYFAADLLWNILGTDGPPGDGSLEAFLQLAHPEDIDRVRNAMDEHIAGKTDRYRCEYRVRLPDGRYRWILATGQIALDALKRNKHFTGAIRDIQLQKDLEATLRRQVAHRDRFLAMLSHELRNPLGAVVNASALLGIADVDPTRAEVATETIKQESTHMAALLDDLLDVSRVTTNKLKMEWEPVDFGALVTEAVSGLRQHAENKSQDLVVNLPEQPVQGTADGSRIRQCVSNLVSNAIKYTPSKGHVTVSLGAADNDVTITVCDDGIGMTSDFLQSVFGLFVQADETLAHSEGGMGVGLALVRAIAELHGGTVEAESNGRDQGSQFELRIPREQNELSSERRDQSRPDMIEISSSVSQEPEQEDSASENSAVTILVIDDLDGGRKTLAMWLELNGFSVLTAASGYAGLEIIEQEHPDVLLVDIGLPDLDGFEIAKRVRAMTGYRPALLAAVTGYGQADDRAKSAAAGFDVHLAKPVDLAVLSDLLQRAGTTQFD